MHRSPAQQGLWNGLVFAMLCLALAWLRLAHGICLKLAGTSTGHLFEARVRPTLAKFTDP
jgi:hypothetical protein